MTVRDDRPDAAPADEAPAERVGSDATAAPGAAAAPDGAGAGAAERADVPTAAVPGSDVPGSDVPKTEVPGPDAPTDERADDDEPAHDESAEAEAEPTDVEHDVDEPEPRPDAEPALGAAPATDAESAASALPATDAAPPQDTQPTRDAAPVTEVEAEPAPDVHPATEPASVPDTQPVADAAFLTGYGPAPEVAPAAASEAAPAAGSEPAPAAQPEVAPAAASEHARAAAPRSAWRALADGARPRLTRAQVLAGILCAVLGFALVAQVRQNRTEGLSNLSQPELVRILDEATQRTNELEQEAAALERTRDELEHGTDTQAAALEAALDRAEVLGILSGRLPAEGPGIEILLTEVNGRISALTMLDVLEELRNAGAEAIQLGSLRLTASSYFVGAEDGIVVDGTTLQAPYQWVAIGDPDTLVPALNIQGGAMAAVRNSGGRGTITARDHVEVTATRVPPEPQYAVPADDADS